MAARNCPFCGVVKNNHTSYWEHVRACPQNTNPTCPKCGFHYAPDKLEGHTSRCGDARRARGLLKEPPADKGGAEAGKPAPTASDVPPEQLTPIDELHLPLKAAPGEKPPPPPAPEKPPRASTRGGRTAKRPAASAAAPERQSGLAQTFEEHRGAPRTAALGGLAESLKKNWLLLLVIVAAVAAVVAWRVWSAREKAREAAATAVQPVQPAVRPPYNPGVHGTLDQYLANFGHLPRGGF